MINLTKAVRLARLVLDRWEKSPEFDLCKRLQIKEPLDVVEARSILTGARMRWNARPTIILDQQKELA